MATETTVYKLDKPTVAGDADVWGGFLNTNADDLDVFFARPRHRRVVSTPGASVAFDLGVAMMFQLTPNQNTVLSFSNIPTTLPNAETSALRVVLVMIGGGQYTITYPTGTDFPGGAAPELSGAGAEDVLEFLSLDGGTTWYLQVLRRGDGSLEVKNKLTALGQIRSPLHDNGNSGSALTVDWDNGNHQRATLTANCTLTFSNGRSGGVYFLELVQDATGSRTVTWPAAVVWPAAIAPTLTTTPLRADGFTFYYDDIPATDKYLGQTFGLNYAV